jgi:hypothetical protein
LKKNRIPNLSLDHETHAQLKDMADRLGTGFIRRIIRQAYQTEAAAQ